MVWDFQTHALRVPLESLVTHPIAELTFVVPGLTAPGAGDLFRTTVLPGIVASDRVVAVVQRPNANVSFEIGLALGLGKPVLLLAWGKERPAWLEARPFGGLYVDSVESASELRVKAASSPCLRIDPGDVASSAARTLALCATMAEADACRQETSISAASWSELPATPFSFEDLDQLFVDVDRLVWTLAAYPDGSDDRDGIENTALAAVAGFFLGRKLRAMKALPSAEDWSNLQKKFVVLRSRSARPLADVTFFEWPWDTLAHYRAHLVQLTGHAPMIERPIATGKLTSSTPAAALKVRGLRFEAVRATKVTAAVFSALMLITCIGNSGRPPLNVWIGAAFVALLAGASTPLVVRGYQVARAALRRSSAPAADDS